MNTLFDLESWRAVFQNSLAALGTSFGAFVPKLLGTIVVLLLGWLVAKVAELASRRTLRRLGLDRLGERVRVSRFLGRAGVTAPPSKIVSRLLFWLLVLTFVITAADSLGLTAVTTTIDRFVAYVPSIIAAGLILVFGLFLARFTRNLIVSAAMAANIAEARRLGNAGHGVVTVLVCVLAVEELGVDTGILVTVITGLVSAAALTMGLAFAIGARPVVTHILAGHFLRQVLAPGGRVVVDGRSGTIDRVGPLDTLIHDDAGAWSIPNGILLDSVRGR